MSPVLWHVLDVGSIWMKEFGSAMARTHPVVCWAPEMSLSGAFERWERTEILENPHLEVLRFPLQRGYAQFPFRALLPFQVPLLRHVEAHSPDPAHTALICTTPFYAPLAEQWPGPVVYYSTDLTAAYHGLHPAQVTSLDRRLCRTAHAVCPNSKRLGEYFVGQAGCSPEKITVVPNATRESNVSPVPLLAPADLPADVAHLPRPIAGVIGNMSGNMDWTLLSETVSRTPEVTWVFVGPTDMAIDEPLEADARARVMKLANFIGARPYGELQAYARSFDVAILPYRKREPTYSGSSTRFYEHLAACRPMLATRGFAELLEKPPLLVLVDTPEEMIAALHRLEQSGFRDGCETLRWEASKTGTWEERVRTLTRTLASPAS